MTGVTVDRSSGAAIIGAGSRLGDIALALDEAGRGIPHGSCAYIGIGGHAGLYLNICLPSERERTSLLLGHGGFGFASRMWGLTVDRVISMDVVLANATIVKASKNTNSDLFWVIFLARYSSRCLNSLPSK